MISMVILGDNLASLSAASHTIDLNPEIEIQIITERAEIGLVEELRACCPRGLHALRTGYPTWVLKLLNPLLRPFEPLGF